MDVDKAVVSRLVVSGQSFEILVDPKKALEFKRGSKVSMDEILAYPAVYKDVRSTEEVAKQDMQRAFGTTDINKIAERIIREGQLQLTTEQRREMVDQKKNQIAELISKRGVNPQTGAPHPPMRILNAMDKAGVNVDPFTDAELQMDGVLKSIKAVMPIKFQKITFEIKVQPQFAGRVYSVLKSIGSVTKERWMNDGSLVVSIEILAGMQSELFNKMSALTHGSFESKVVKKVYL